MLTPPEIELYNNNELDLGEEIYEEE